MGDNGIGRSSVHLGDIGLLRIVAQVVCSRGISLGFGDDMTVSLTICPSYRDQQQALRASISLGDNSAVSPRNDLSIDVDCVSRRDREDLFHTRSAVVGKPGIEPVLKRL